MVKRYAFGMVRIFAVGIATLYFTYSYLRAYAIPEGWIFLSVGWLCALFLIGTLYFNALQVSNKSIINEVFKLAWQTAALL
ncbi:hypothetical protein ACFLU6_11940, partial [Acidobacteriota bacterium]